MSETVRVASIPNCDLWEKYGMHEEDRPAVVDGATTLGPWAYMCQDCFKRFGIGLGTGKGQQLILAKE